MSRLAMRIASGLSRLRRDRSGVALLEFAYSLPLVLGVGLYGVETANLALVNLRVSQAALNLADNAGRVGLEADLSTYQLREVDINDVLAGVKTYGNDWELTTRGRIILSSLENKDGVQSIHWQRCLGLKNGADFDSHYGTTTITDGTDKTAATDGTLQPDGMGPTGRKISAPRNAGVMFVEINYLYKPVVSGAWLSDSALKIHYIASFIVRDRRDFSQIFNPNPAADRATCDKYTAT